MNGIHPAAAQRCVGVLLGGLLLVAITFAVVEAGQDTLGETGWS